MITAEGALQLADGTNKSHFKILDALDVLIQDAALNGEYKTQYLSKLPDQLHAQAYYVNYIKRVLEGLGFNVIISYSINKDQEEAVCFDISWQPNKEEHK